MTFHERRSPSLGSRAFPGGFGGYIVCSIELENYGGGLETAGARAQRERTASCRRCVLCVGAWRSVAFAVVQQQRRGSTFDHASHAANIF